MDDPQNEQVGSNKAVNMMKVEIPTDDPRSTPREIACGNHSHGLTRQQSMSKTASANCLCSPTTHVGSFRCRLHRSSSLKSPSFQRLPSLQRTHSSIQYASSSSPPSAGGIEATSKPSAG